MVKKYKTMFVHYNRNVVIMIGNFLLDFVLYYQSHFHG